MLPVSSRTSSRVNIKVEDVDSPSSSCKTHFRTEVILKLGNTHWKYTVQAHSQGHQILCAWLSQGVSAWHKQHELKNRDALTPPPLTVTHTVGDSLWVLQRGRRGFCLPCHSTFPNWNIWGEPCLPLFSSSTCPWSHDTRTNGAQGRGKQGPHNALSTRENVPGGKVRSLSSLLAVPGAMRSDSF